MWVLQFWAATDAHYVGMKAVCDTALSYRILHFCWNETHPKASRTTVKQEVLMNGATFSHSRTCMHACRFKTDRQMTISSIAPPQLGLLAPARHSNGTDFVYFKTCLKCLLSQQPRKPCPVRLIMFQLLVRPTRWLKFKSLKLPYRVSYYAACLPLETTNCIS